MKNIKKSSKKSKFILSMLIVLMLTSVFGALGCSPSTNEEEPPEIKGIQYTLKEDNTYNVKGYNGDESVIVIPETYEGLPVTEIGYDAFEGLKTLNEITIPESIIKIDDGAFTNCENLKKVNYNVKRLDDQDDPFRGFSPFRFKTIGSAIYTPDEFVVNIGVNVEEIPDCLFRDIGVTQLNFAEGSKCESIGKSAFSNSQITDLILPNGLKNLKYGAFDSSKKLVNVSIPNTVEKIGAYVFGGCSNLVKTVYENGNYIGNAENPYFALLSTTIDAQTKEINVHENTKFILTGAIYAEFTSLNSVNLPDGLKGICGFSIIIIDDVIFNIFIPNSVEYIGDFAFNRGVLVVVNCEAKSKPDGWEKSWYKFNYDMEVRQINWDSKR